MGIPLGKVAKENERAIHKREKTKEKFKRCLNILIIKAIQ